MGFQVGDVVRFKHDTGRVFTVTSCGESGILTMRSPVGEVFGVADSFLESAVPDLRAATDMNRCKHNLPHAVDCPLCASEARALRLRADVGGSVKRYEASIGPMSDRDVIELAAALDKRDKPPEGLSVAHGAWLKQLQDLRAATQAIRPATKEEVGPVSVTFGQEVSQRFMVAKPEPSGWDLLHGARGHEGSLKVDQITSTEGQIGFFDADAAQPSPLHVAGFPRLKWERLSCSGCDRPSDFLLVEVDEPRDLHTLCSDCMGTPEKRTAVEGKAQPKPAEPEATYGRGGIDYGALLRALGNYLPSTPPGTVLSISDPGTVDRFSMVQGVMNGKLAEPSRPFTKPAEPEVDRPARLHSAIRYSDAYAAWARGEVLKRALGNYLPSADAPAALSDPGDEV